MGKPIWFPCMQGSEEWVGHRLGKITTSNFSRFMGGAVGARTYALDLIGERMTQRPHDAFFSKYTDWGKEHEPSARASYAFRTGNNVDEVGFAVHGDLAEVGASSDGLIGRQGNVEFKCPATTKEHLRVAASMKVPRQYKAQLDGQLWVLDRQWTDFVSYDPRMPEEYQLAIVRYERDDQAIAAIRVKLEMFLDEIHQLEYLIQGNLKNAGAS